MPYINFESLSLWITFPKGQSARMIDCWICPRTNRDVIDRLCLVSIVDLRIWIFKLFVNGDLLHQMKWHLLQRERLAVQKGLVIIKISWRWELWKLVLLFLELQVFHSQKKCWDLLEVYKKHECEAIEIFEFCALTLCLLSGHYSDTDPIDRYFNTSQYILNDVIYFALHRLGLLRRWLEVFWLLFLGIPILFEFIIADFLINVFQINRFKIEPGSRTFRLLICLIIGYRHYQNVNLYKMIMKNWFANYLHWILLLAYSSQFVT